MKLSTALVGCTTALCLALPAQAQHKLSPGLWESEMKIASGGPDVDAALERMQRAMASMTPEQRAQMEAMMAQRGIAMASGAGQPTKVRSCISAEQAARDEMPQDQGHCRQTSRTRSGNTVRYTFACSGERAAQGEGEFTFVSPREHQGRVRVTTTRGSGQPATMDMSTHSRWLGADCGDLKPRP